MPALFLVPAFVKAMRLGDKVNKAVLYDPAYAHDEADQMEFKGLIRGWKAVKPSDSKCQKHDIRGPRPYAESRIVTSITHKFSQVV